jgi:plasmid stabilization system protein ParE
MAGKGFEHLRIYQLAEKLADQIWDIIQKWTVLARDTVGKQMVRAADSIGANIAEGYGRGSYQDNRRFVRIARVPFTRPAIGCEGPIRENCSPNLKLTH